MTTSESKGRFFYKTNRFESIGITNRIESIRIANWNALLLTAGTPAVQQSTVISWAYIQNGHKPKRPQTKTAIKRYQNHIHLLVINFFYNYR